MKQQSNRKSMWRATAVACGIALALGTAHLACKQDGSGGPSFGDILKPVASAVGGTVGVDSRITNTAVAGITYLEKISISPAIEDQMGQSVAVSLTNQYQLTRDTALNKYVSLVGLAIANASDPHGGRDRL
jgi:predicted Zn-dependent protease